MVSLRACLHEGGGPQLGDVNMIKLKWEIIWTRGLSHLSGLPHLPGVPHPHVNRPQVVISIKLGRSFFFYLKPPLNFVQWNITNVYILFTFIHSYLFAISHIITIKLNYYWKVKRSRWRRNLPERNHGAYKESGFQRLKKSESYMTIWTSKKLHRRKI